MSVTAKIYPKALEKAFNGEIDFTTDTFKMMILNASHSYSAAHDYLNDVDTTEISAGGGYSAGGPTVDNLAIAASGETVTIDMDDETIAASTITGRSVVIYKSTGTASTSPLIATFISSADIISTSGDWTLAVNGSGLITITTN